MALLEIGDRAPDVTARRRDGSTLQLSSLRGRYVLVYFYPKDDTPGCTAEARGLNDNLSALTESGADVIGVSTDSWESHQRFAEKYGLEFALASDADHRIREAYGVGKVMGFLPATQRVSFLVGPDGRIAHVWPRVKAAAHAAEVLDEVRRRTTQAAAAG
jgi:thioredoxin-dependent peroxiredoxin